MRRVTFGVTLLAVVLIAVGIGVGAAYAQADSDPVAFTGTVTDADGTEAPNGTTIVATVENGTDGETTIDSPGSYGGGLNSLVVGAENDTVTVQFYVGSTDGPEAQESPETFDVAQGEHTHNLTFPAGTFDSDDDDDEEVAQGGGGGAGGVDAGSDDDETADDDEAVDDDETTDDAEADDTEPTDDTESESADDETDDSTPGFGIGTALIALSGLFVFARRLSSSHAA